MRSAAFAAMVIGSLAASDAAQAISAGCADLNASPSRGTLYPRYVAVLTSQPFDEGEVVTISGTSASGFAAGSWYFYEVATNTQLSASFPQPSGAFSETLTVPTGGLQDLAVRENGANFTQLDGVTVSCVAVAADEAFADPLSQISRAGTERAITTAMSRNSRARLTGSGGAPVVGQDRLFVSTQSLGFDPDLPRNLGLRSDYNLWVSADWRSYSDALDGSSADLLVGGDRLVADRALIGLFAGAGRAELEDTASIAKAMSTLVGAYFARKFERDIILDGYLALGTAEYEVDGAEFDTDRTFAGLTLSGVYEGRAGSFQPRLRIAGSWEDFPAYAGSGGGVPAGTAHSLRASLGGRFDWAAPLGRTDLRPFLSLDLEYGDAESATGIGSDFVAPRLGLGIAGQVGKGYLDAEFDVGRAAEGVVDAGFRFAFDLRF